MTPPERLSREASDWFKEKRYSSSKLTDGFKHTRKHDDICGSGQTLLLMMGSVENKTKEAVSLGDGLIAPDSTQLECGPKTKAEECRFGRIAATRKHQFWCSISIFILLKSSIARRRRLHASQCRQSLLLNVLFACASCFLVHLSPANSKMQQTISKRSLQTSARL
jgi:hypothetical protein